MPPAGAPISTGMVATARKGLVCALAAVSLLALAAPAGAVQKKPSRSIAAADGLEYQVLRQVNAVRSRHELRPLRLSRSLSFAAEQHSRDMARLGYFSHTSLDGSPFWKRIQRHYGVGSHEYWSVGENLLWASPDIDADETVRRWMASPKHRANLLSARWRDLGLSAVRAAAAPRAFRGLDVTIVTAEFGVRA